MEFNEIWSWRIFQIFCKFLFILFLLKGFNYNFMTLFNRSKYTIIKSDFDMNRKRLILAYQTLEHFRSKGLLIFQAIRF